MKKTLLLLATAMPLLAQQTFDFKTLDKLGANAKGSTNISLDANTLKMAGGLLGGDKENAKAALANLRNVQIRSFEFDGPGKYNDADLEPFRSYLAAQQWTKIVDVKDSKETSQIYMLPQASGQMGGIAIVSAEPKEVTVVFIDGNLKMDDLAKLSGTMGIPDITLNHAGKDKDGKKEE